MMFRMSQDVQVPLDRQKQRRQRGYPRVARAEGPRSLMVLDASLDGSNRLADLFGRQL